MVTKSRQHEVLVVDRPEVFLRRERTAQRIGIALLTMMVVAGAAGGFGNGPLSHATTSSGTLTVTYERFTRQSFRTEMAVQADVPGATSAEIRVARAFLTSINVLEVRPAGALRRLDADFAIFEVPSAQGRAFLELQYEPHRFGLLETDIAVADLAPARVRQIVFF